MSAPFPAATAVVRAVVAEPVTALLVQRALVMEVAHPAVAAAVAHHSDFQAHPLRRAWATTDAAVRLVFGNGHVARWARPGRSTPSTTTSTGPWTAPPVRIPRSRTSEPPGATAPTTRPC